MKPDDPGAGPTMKFDELGLVTAVLQDERDGTVLMVAHMDAEALELTRRTGLAHFYSRSRQRIWKKGETSGNVQRVRSITPDCDGDALLVRVDPAGPACHTGARSCFETPGKAPGEAPGERGAGPEILLRLARVIADRRENPVPGSYTAYLFGEGLDKILKKIGEEAAEVLIAAKGTDPEAIVRESADLVYHLLVLLEDRGIGLDRLLAELGTRRAGSDGAPRPAKPGGVGS